MNIIFKSLYVLITEINGFITIKNKNIIIFIIGLSEIIGGMLIYYASKLLRLSDDGAMEKFFLWASVILIPIGILMLIIGLFQKISSRIIFNCNSHEMIKGSKKYSFMDIKDLITDEICIGDKKIFFAVASLNNQVKVKLFSDTNKEKIDKITGYLKKRIITNEQTIADIAVPITDSNRIKANGALFTGIIMIFIGIIWALTGYFFLHNIIIALHDYKHGPLLWPFGIWIAALGILELFGLQIYKRFIKDNNFIRILLLFLWIGSYFLVCWK